jgi:hypothetical protein
MLWYVLLLRWELQAAESRRRQLWNPRTYASSDPCTEANPSAISCTSYPGATTATSDTIATSDTKA